MKRYLNIIWGNKKARINIKQSLLVLSLLFISLIVSAAPQNPIFNPIIKDAHNNIIPFTFQFKDRLTGQQINPISKGRIIPGLYDLELTLINNPIKKITIKGLVINSDIISFLNVDDTPENIKRKADIWSSVLAIDPSYIDFDNITLLINSTGNKLYKCSEWDFFGRTCTGRWARQPITIKSGELYEVVLYNATDPSYSEINATNAEHLDANYNFISDIWDSVKAQDDIWSEYINYSDYIRVYFEHELEQGNTIDILSRNTQDINCTIELYEVNSTNLLSISHLIYYDDYDNETPYHYTENWEHFNIQQNITPSDVFDLKVSGDANCKLEVDYLHDDLTGVPILVDTSAKPPLNATKVQFQSVLKNATGYIFAVIGSTMCYNADNTYNSMTCYRPFDTNNAANFSCAITSYGRIGCVYTNSSPNYQIHFAYSDNWASATPIWNIVQLNNSFPLSYNTNFMIRTGNVIVDKDDNFQGCAVASFKPGGVAFPNPAGSQNENVTWWINSSNGISWNATNISNTAVFGSYCDVEATNTNDGTTQIHIVSMDGFVNVAHLHRAVHFNFTPSDNPIPTETQVFAGTTSATPKTLSFTLSADREGTLYLTREILSDDALMYVSKNGGLTWIATTLATPQNAQETDYPDCISDNPDSIRCLVQQDYNTADDMIYYINSSDNGTTYNATLTLQNGTTTGDDTGYAHQLGSRYPAFNHPRYSATQGLLHYFYWSDGFATDSWYYANYSYQWKDIAIPNWRRYSDNITNGTLNQSYYASIQCFDESNISGIKLSIINGTYGNWYNFSINNYASPQYYQSANISFELNNTCGNTIKWRFHCNDTAGNWMTTLNYTIQTQDCPPPTLPPLTNGMYVWVNSSNTKTLGYAFLYPNATISLNYSIPFKNSYDIAHILIEAPTTRNEVALYLSSGDWNYPNGEYLLLWNNISGWYKNYSMARTGNDAWKGWDMCYTSSGKLVVAMINYTESGATGRTQSCYRYSVWDGVVLSNYSGDCSGLTPSQAVSIVKLACNKNNENVLFMYGYFSSGDASTTCGNPINLHYKILNVSTNVFTSDAGSGDVRNCLSGNIAYGGSSFDGGWYNNGNALVCYSPTVYTTSPSSECRMWNTSIGWKVKMKGKGSTGSYLIYTGQVECSFFGDTPHNDSCIYTYDTGATEYMMYERLNATNYTTSGRIDTYANPDYHFPLDAFAYTNSTRNVSNGTFIYRKYYLSTYYNRYVQWWDAKKGISTDKAIVTNNMYQGKVYSDPNSIYVVSNRAYNNQVKSYLYNESNGLVTSIGTINYAYTGSQAYNTHSFAFLSTTALDIKEPYWNNNLTPTGILRRNTSTSLSVKLNDDFSKTGLYKFSLNDTGWINTSDISWTPNEQVYNTSTIKSKRGAIVQWKWYFNDSAGNKNETDIFSFNVSNTPVFFKYYPQDYIVTVVDGYNTTFFAYDCYDIDGDSYSVEWYINGTQNVTGSNECRNLDYNWTTGDEGKDKNITVRINDSYDNVTVQWLLRIKAPPSCSNPSENYPLNASNYVYGQNVIMNTTCSAGANSITDVRLQFYDSHNVTFDELNDLGNGIYRYSATNFSAGSTRHCWMVTDNLGNNNYADCHGANSNEWTYTINKSNVSMTLFVNVTSPINYGEHINISCNSSTYGAKICLYANNTELGCSNRITSPVLINYEFKNNISAGDHIFSCISDAIHQNYTYTYTYNVITINKVKSDCYLSFAQNPVTLPDKVNASAYCTNPESEYNFTMYREEPESSGIFINNTNETNVNATLPAGVYVYKVNVTETENYTKGYTISVLEVLEGEGSVGCMLIEPINDTADGNDSRILNWSVTHTSEANINTTVFVSENINNLSISNYTSYWDVNTTFYNKNASELKQDTIYYWMVNGSSGSKSCWSDIWQFEVTLGLADGQQCTTDAQCSSGYCDNVNPTISPWMCYAPYETYFHNTSSTNISCEYHNNVDEHYLCDEIINMSSAGTCNNFGQSYFLDYCNNSCVLQDTNSSIFICSSVGDGCTASPKCNGVQNGTGQCTSACVYDPCLPPLSGDWMLDNIQCIYDKMVLQIVANWNLTNVIIIATDSLFNFTTSPSFINLNLSSYDDFRLKNVTIGGNVT